MILSFTPFIWHQENSVRWSINSGESRRRLCHL